MLGNDGMLHVVGNNVKGVLHCQHNQASHTVQDAKEHHMGHSWLWLGACGTGTIHKRHSRRRIFHTVDNRLPVE